MTPEAQLRLVTEELVRWMGDVRPAPVREAVHLERLGWIMRVDVADATACLVDNS